MASARKCCVPSCGIKNEILHKFPNPDKDPERFKMWVYTIGGHILVKDNLYIYKYRRVCHLHFEEKFHTRNKTLSANAIPTLCLSGPNKELCSENQATQLSHEDDTGSDTDSDVLPEAPAEEPVPKPKNFTWQKPNEVVPVLADDDTTEEVVDNLFMYCDDGDHALMLSEQLDGNNKCERVAMGLAASGQERRDETVKLSAHEVFRCNVCDSTIAGFRYTCVQCSDLDLCGACEAARAHHHHYVLRVPADRLATQVHLVLAVIRRHLMRKLDPIALYGQDQDDAISVKSEVKSEEEDHDKNVHDDSNDGDDDCNETNQLPEVDVLNRSTSPGLPQHGDSDGETDAVDSGKEAPRGECGKARTERNATKIYLKLADFMALKESQSPRVQILNPNETTRVGMPNAQQQAEEAVVLSGTVAADSRSRVQHASAHSRFKKRCVSSDLSPDTTSTHSYNTHHLVRDYAVRLSTIPDATMNVRQRLPTQTQASSGDSRGRSDEDNR